MLGLLVLVDGVDGGDVENLNDLASDDDMRADNAPRMRMNKLYASINHVKSCTSSPLSGLHSYQ